LTGLTLASTTYRMYIGTIYHLLRVCRNYSYRPLPLGF
jgi:hypothetical protein